MQVVFLSDAELHRIDMRANLKEQAERNCKCIRDYWQLLNLNVIQNKSYNWTSSNKSNALIQVSPCQIGKQYLR